MLVIYLKRDERVIGWTYSEPQITETSIISDELKLKGIDFDKIGYRWYKDKRIYRQYDELGGEISLYLDNLSLEPITAKDLPVSEHIGKLIAVTSQAKPAVVRRRFWGENYDMNCLVTQSVKDMFQAGDIQIGDFVLVSFIEEIPNTTERQIAIVTDKVYKSW